jgi:hypothetical protein
LLALLLLALLLLLLPLFLGLLALLVLALLLLLLPLFLGLLVLLLLLALLLLALLLGLLTLLFLLLPLFLGLLALLLLALLGLLALLLLLLALLLLALLLGLLALLFLLLTALLGVRRPWHRWRFRALLHGALGGRTLGPFGWPLPTLACAARGFDTLRRLARWRSALLRLTRRGAGRLTRRRRLRAGGGCLRGSRGACAALELSAAAAIFFLGRCCSRLSRRDDLHISGWRRSRCRRLLRSCGRLGRPARIGRASCLAGGKCGRRRRRLGPGDDLALHRPRWRPA